VVADPDSIERALSILADPSHSEWGTAFGFLASQPDTAELVLEIFQETLEALGVEPAGRDPATGEPAYSLSDVAQAMGIPDADPNYLRDD
jgi:hypothetical protein